MYWKRILLFAGLFLLIASGISFVLHTLAVLVTRQALPMWWMQATNMVIYGALFILGFKLGQKQRERLWKHAALIVLLGSTWAIFQIVSFLLYVHPRDIVGPAVLGMSLGLLLQIGVMLTGVFFGKRSRGDAPPQSAAYG